MPERKFVYKYQGAWQEIHGITLATLEQRINANLASHPSSLSSFEVFELVPFPVRQAEVPRVVVETKVVFVEEIS